MARTAWGIDALQRLVPYLGKSAVRRLYVHDDGEGDLLPGLIAGTLSARQARARGVCVRVCVLY